MTASHSRPKVAYFYDPDVSDFDLLFFQLSQIVTVAGWKFPLWAAAPYETPQTQCHPLPCSQLWASQEDAGTLPMISLYQNYLCSIASLYSNFIFRFSGPTLPQVQTWPDSTARNTLNFCRGFPPTTYRYLSQYLLLNWHPMKIVFFQSFSKSLTHYNVGAADCPVFDGLWTISNLIQECQTNHWFKSISRKCNHSCRSVWVLCSLHWSFTRSSWEIGEEISSDSFV